MAFPNQQQPAQPPNWPTPGGYGPPGPGAPMAPRRPVWRRSWFWAALAVVVVVLAAGGALVLHSAHQSNLSADDQQFCSSLSDDPVASLRSDVDHLAGNNHFASAGAAMAFAEVDLGQGYNVLRNANLQDAGLAQARDAATSAMLSLSLGVNSGSTAAPEQQLQQVHDDLHALKGYCDTH